MHPACAFAWEDQGAMVVATVMDVHGYVSPDWYADGVNQVPTWNYRLVEIESVVTPLPPDQTLALITELSVVHEARLAPKAPWTMDKVAPQVRDALLNGIVGYALTITALRGTAKLSQNKTAADRVGVRSGLRGRGKDALAALIPAEAP